MYFLKIVSVFQFFFNFLLGQIVVILFISQDIVEALFDLINTYDVTYNNFIWIAGDAWTGRHVKPSIRNVIKNAVGIQPMIKSIQAFDEYFTAYVFVFYWLPFQNEIYEQKIWSHCKLRDMRSSRTPSLHCNTIYLDVKVLLCYFIIIWALIIFWRS